MTRYIDAEKLRERIERMGYDQIIKDNFHAMAITIPAADVQPVVHCVNCKYRNDISVCILNDIFINEKDFCSKGDKLDGDEHDNR